MPVTHSPFLQALGYAIINSLWQFALLWLIYVLLNTVLKLSSRQKYLAGYSLQIAGFTWSVATFLIYFRRFYETADYFSLLQQTYSSLTIGGHVTASERFLIWVTKTELLLPYLSISYLLLLIFLGSRYFQAYNYTQVLRKKGLAEIDISWRLFVKDLADKLKIRHEVKIFLSEKVNTPLTVGFLKPLILIPLASINNLTTHQAEAIILHELAHIKRYDYFFNLFLAFAETALFFNPFMRLISRHIQRERENCCDDYVLKYEYNPASYARALLHIASFQTPSAILALKATDDKQILLTRVKRMIERKEKKFFNFRQQFMALVVMTTVLALLAFLSGSTKGSSASAISHSTPALQAIDMASKSSFIFPVSDFSGAKKYPAPVRKKLGQSKIISRKLVELTVNKTGKQENIVKQERGNPGIEIVPAPPHILINPSNNPPMPISLEEETAVIPNNKNEEFEAVQLQNFYEDQQKNFNADKKRSLEELRCALEEIKTGKQKQQLAKLSEIATAGKVRISKLQKELFKVFREPDKKDVLELTIKQIQGEIEQIKTESFLSTKEASNMTFTVQFPAIIYTSPAPEALRSFSYEYSPKPNQKTYTASPSAEAKRENTSEKPALPDDEAEFKAQVKRFREVIEKPRTRIIRVIKI